MSLKEKGGYKVVNKVNFVVPAFPLFSRTQCAKKKIQIRDWQEIEFCNRHTFFNFLKLQCRQTLIKVRGVKECSGEKQQDVEGD